ncbi:hypothetical protein D3C76_403760 [compost metagenome]
MTDFLFGGSKESEVKAATDGGGLVFNLTDVKEDSGFEVLPKGDYNAVVDELEFGESKKGNPMVTVKFKITDGEHENRVLFDYWVLAGDGAEFGLGKLKKFLVRIMPEMDLSAFNVESFAEEALAIGREVTLSVRVQKVKKGEYAGTFRNNIGDIQAASGGAFL